MLRYYYGNENDTDINPCEATVKPDAPLCAIQMWYKYSLIVCMSIAANFFFNPLTDVWNLWVALFTLYSFFHFTSNCSRLFEKFCLMLLHICVITVLNIMHYFLQTNFGKGQRVLFLNLELFNFVEKNCTMQFNFFPCQNTQVILCTEVIISCCTLRVYYSVPLLS